MDYKAIIKKVLIKFNADLYAHYAKSFLVNKDYYHRYYQNLTEEQVDNNTYLFESKHGQTFEGHIFYLLRELRKEKPKAIIYLTYQNNKEKFQSLLDNYGIDNVNLVKIKTVEYYKILATAKYLINDTTFIKRFVKRQEQIYINTWHGTPLKKLGKDLSDKLAIMNVEKNFFVTDYLIHSNEYTNNVMKNAYQLNGIYKGHNMVAPSIRNSVLFDLDRRDFLRKKLNLEKKKVVVYLPTYRGNYHEGKNAQQIVKDLKLIDENIDENVNFYVKLHPLDADIDFNSFKNIKAIPTDYELYDFLTTSDLLISDYSSIMYDYLNMNKEIVLYLYDQEEYFSTRGVYDDIDDYDFTKIRKIEELIKKINEIKTDYFYDYPQEKAKFTYLDNKNGAKQLVDYLFNQTKSEKIMEESLINEKKTIAFYVGDLRDNGITSSFLNTLDNIDFDLYNILVVFISNKNAITGVKKLEKYLDKIAYYPVATYLLGSYKTKMIERKYVFSKLEENLPCDENIVKMINLYNDSLFGNVKIDYFVHFTGYESTFSLMMAHSKADYRKIIYVHSDMPEEFKNRKIIGSKSIVDAYENADDVVLVNAKLEKNLVDNFPRSKENIRVINNFLGHEKVIKQAQEDLQESLNDVQVTNFANKNKKDLLNDLKNDNVRTLIAIGRMDKVKGFDRLIKAYNEVMGNDGNYRLIIITINNEPLIYKQLKKEIQAGNAKDKIYLLSRMNNPFPLLKACDCFVLSSLYEGTGLVLFEALALGKQVITTKLDVFDNLLSDKQAIIVENSNKGIVDGLKRYKKGERSSEKFDFSSSDKRSMAEFERVFNKN